MVHFNCRLGIKIGGGVIGFLLLIWLIFLGVHAYGLYQNYQSAKELLASSGTGSAAGKSLSLQRVKTIAQDSQSHLQGLRAGLSPLFPVFNLLRGMPGQVQPLFDYAISGLDAAHSGLEIVQPAWDQIQAGQGKAIPLFVKALNDHPDQLKALMQAIQQTARLRQAIQPELLPEKIATPLRAVDPVLDMAQKASGALGDLPALAGAGQERVYLVVAQNSDELRATGGFISSMGLLHVRDGEIISLTLNDAYSVDNFNVDYPNPPQPFMDYWLAEMWMPRDANWSPDFPTAARKIEELYQLSTNQSVDGVIVFDQTFVKMLLQVLGPVQVEGMEPISSENVISWMHSAWSPGEGEKIDLVWMARRKTFIPLLGKAMIARLTENHDMGQLRAVATQLIEIIRQGHLLVYFHQPEMQQALAELDMDGGVRPGSGDFLFLVDSNMGFNKVDAIMQRSLQYQVDLRQPETPKARLTIQYTNPNTQAVPCKHEAQYGKTYNDMMIRCYWDYWRVLTAPSSVLTHTTAQVVPAEEILSHKAWLGQANQQGAEGNTVQLDGFQVTATHSSQSIELEWQLVPTVLKMEGRHGSYQLRIQKQPGVISYPASVEVSLPAGMSIQNPPAGWQPQKDGSVWRWQGMIDRTTAFNLDFAAR